jgi:hypothetical protein
MLLSGALSALFMMGFWLYCLTDAVLTPASECRGMTKPTWIVIITVTFIGGAIAWLIVRQPPRHSSTPPPRWDRDPGEPGYPSGPGDPGEDCFRTERWTDAGDAVARHPAGRTRVAAPRGPDDDPEFLRALDRVIRGSSQAGEEV